ncbi:MAG: hypothetical protein KAX38_09415, partial [Candidatus Krumholzibacteria bacterium]|nr:hypothetical protein [Candidatus Krumholzibacteria bacterium]
KVVVSSELPDGMESCLGEIRENEVLSVWKDVPYLKWRYEKHPDFDYTFHVLFARGRPEGLIVTRVHGQSIAICEVLHRTKNVSQTAFLLSHVLKYFHFSDDQSIKFYGYDSGFFDAVFSRCGFSIDTSSDLVFGGRVFGDVKLEKVFIFPHNWTVAYGDTDVI